MVQNTPHTSAFPFEALPSDIHQKIGAILDLRGLINLIQTCPKCNKLYDTAYNWKPFLKEEYQGQVPKQLSKEMFTLEVRKKYGIKFQHSNSFLAAPLIKYLSKKASFNQQDVPFMSEPELLAVYNRLYAVDYLIENKILSPADTANLTDKQADRLGKCSICWLLRFRRASLKQVINLTDEQVDRLCARYIYDLLTSGKLSLKQGLNLTDKQFNRLSEDNILWLFSWCLLSLEQIENLTDKQVNRLAKEEIQLLFSTKQLSLEQIDSLTDKQADNLCIDNIKKLFYLNRLSLEQIATLTDKQVERLSRHDICELFNKNKLSLEEIDGFTVKQLEKLSKIYKLHGSDQLSLEEIDAEIKQLATREKQTCSIG